MARIQRAAMVLASLPASEAEALIERLSPNQVAAVLSELARMAPVQSDELRLAAQELFDHARAGRNTGPVPVGDESSDSLDWAGAESGGEAPANQVFDFLRDREPSRIAELLELERPQTVAAVLARLGGQLADEILAELPEQIQGEVTSRLAEREPADSESLRRLARALQRRLDEQPLLATASEGN